jgi:mRNA interferase RelE/StbE
MAYKIEFMQTAATALASLPRNVQERINVKITALTENPHPRDAKILRGKHKLYRIRVGDYRIIYQIEHHRLVILIVKIGHRKNIYRF